MSRLGKLFSSGTSRSLHDPAFLLGLLEHMAVASFVLDRSGVVILWNKTCEELTGLPATQVIGTKEHWKGFYSAAQPCPADLVLAGKPLDLKIEEATQDEQVGRNGGMKTEDWCDLPRSGRYYLAIDAVPVRDAKGDLIAVIETLQNLTAVKKLEEKRWRAVETVEAAVKEEHANVSNSIGVAMAKLAAKDLTYRMAQDIPQAYANLRTDFNAAITELADVIKAAVDSAGAIHSGTGEITTAVDDLARRTEQQAASLQETAASLAEITATVSKTAEGAQHARDIVSGAKADGEKSGIVVRDAIEAMRGIEKASKQVSQIIGVIDEIAFQTNLLALNAGVEAARAGDAGRGFAVVASEVRALAQRSAEAAKEIKGLISASAAQVDHGVELVEETGKALGRIVAQVTEINNVVSAIATSAQEQAGGLHQVNTAVNQMDQVTQQNAAMVEETRAASLSLSEETAQLSTLISHFQIDGAPAAVRRAREPVPRARPARKASAASRGNTAIADKWEEF